MNNEADKQLYELFFEGPSDERPETLRDLKGVLLTRFDLSVEEAQSVIQHLPITVKKAGTAEELQPFYEALKLAGGKVLIVSPEGADENEEGNDDVLDMSFEVEEANLEDEAVELEYDPSGNTIDAVGEEETFALELDLGEFTEEEEEPKEVPVYELPEDDGFELSVDTGAEEKESEEKLAVAAAEEVPEEPVETPSDSASTGMEFQFDLDDGGEAEDKPEVVETSPDSVDEAPTPAPDDAPIFQFDEEGDDTKSTAAESAEVEPEKSEESPTPDLTESPGLSFADDEPEAVEAKKEPATEEKESEIAQSMASEFSFDDSDAAPETVSEEDEQPEPAAEMPSALSFDDPNPAEEEAQPTEAATPVDSGLSLDAEEKADEQEAAAESVDERKPEKSEVKKNVPNDGPAVSLAQLAQQKRKKSVQQEELEDDDDEDDDDLPQKGSGIRLDMVAAVAVGLVVVALAYFNFFYDIGADEGALSQDIVAKAKQAATEKPKKKKQKKLPPPPEAMLSGETVTDEFRFAWEAVIRGTLLAELTVKGSSTESPVLSPEQIVRGEYRKPWIKKFELEQMQFERRDNDVTVGTGVGRVYIQHGEHAERIVAKATVVATAVAEPDAEIRGTVSMLHGYEQAPQEIYGVSIGAPETPGQGEYQLAFHAGISSVVGQLDIDPADATGDKVAQEVTNGTVVKQAGEESALASEETESEAENSTSDDMPVEKPASSSGEESAPVLPAEE